MTGLKYLSASLPIVLLAFGCASEAPSSDCGEKCDKKADSGVAQAASACLAEMESGLLEREHEGTIEDADRYAVLVATRDCLRRANDLAGGAIENPAPLRDALDNLEASGNVCHEMTQASMNHHDVPDFTACDVRFLQFVGEAIALHSPYESSYAPAGEIDKADLRAQATGCYFEFDTNAAGRDSTQAAKELATCLLDNVHFTALYLINSITTVNPNVARDGAELYAMIDSVEARMTYFAETADAMCGVLAAAGPHAGAEGEERDKHLCTAGLLARYLRLIHSVDVDLGVWPTPDN